MKMFKLILIRIKLRIFRLISGSGKSKTIIKQHNFVISRNDDSIPSYSFRIRFIRSPTGTIQTEEFELHMPILDGTMSIALKSPSQEHPIKDAEQLILSGNGYSSEKVALETGIKYQVALMVALARARVGADFGTRVAKGLYTEHGLEFLENQIGQRVLNNTHGLMTFATEPKPHFASITAKMVRGISAEAFQNSLIEAIGKRPSLSDREKLAYSLFNASFFQPNADSRFILLVMAIEALIEPIARSNEACEHVELLITQTKESAISLTEKNSMLGTLRFLFKESITQAGKRLVISRLGEREYNGMSASKFFTVAYQMRSNLVHGNLPYPTFEEVGSICATIEVFVSDLITSPILGHPK